MSCCVSLPGRLASSNPVQPESRTTSNPYASFTAIAVNQLPVTVRHLPATYRRPDAFILKHSILLQAYTTFPRPRKALAACYARFVGVPKWAKLGAERVLTPHRAEFIFKLVIAGTDWDRNGTSREQIAKNRGVFRRYLPQFSTRRAGVGTKICSRFSPSRCCLHLVSQT